MFTLTPIAKGQAVPLSNDEEARVIPEEELAHLPPAYANYYVPDREGRWWGPIDYHRMSIGWYLNHSTAPNLDVSAGFTARRDIAIDEELTIDYRYWRCDWVDRRPPDRRPSWYRLVA